MYVVLYYDVQAVLSATPPRVETIQVEYSHLLIDVTMYLLWRS